MMESAILVSGYGGGGVWWKIRLSTRTVAADVGRKMSSSEGLVGGGGGWDG